MKLIIAGSRSLDGPRVYNEIAEFAKCWSYGLVPRGVISEIISGCARGVDQVGERYALDHSIQCKRFPADWGKHKYAAGHIRNREMAKYADSLLAIWDGASRGTENMIETMRKLGKSLHVVRLEAARRYSPWE